ncbi:hypothetical protein D9M70_539830 [compost metagenome]
MEEAVFVLIESVAGQVPAVADIIALAGVRHIAAAGRAAHRELADRTARDLPHLVIDDPGFVATDRLAGRGGLAVLKAVGNEDVQHLCRADPVEDRLAGFFRPFLEDRPRQRFARRDRYPERRKVSTVVHRLHHRPIGGRSGKRDRCFVLLDDLHHVGGRRVLEQRCRRAETQGEDGKAAETEGEGERR